MSWLESLTIDSTTIPAWRKLRGLGSPPPRQDVRDRSRRHGSVNRTTYYQPRLLEITDAVLKGDPANIWADLDALKGAFALGTDHIIRFRRKGAAADERMAVTVASEVQADVAFDVPGAILWSAAFMAADPRIYSDTLSIGSYQPSSGGAGGLSFPLEFPLTFSSSPDSALLQAQNGGNFWTPPVWTVHGPAVNPQIVNETTGDTIATIGLALLAGDTLTVDVAERAVLIGGTSRPDVIDASASTWGELAKGVNVIRLLGSGFDIASGTALAVAFRDARI
jgi:hypothetical protein